MNIINGIKNTVTYVIGGLGNMFNYVIEWFRGPSTPKAKDTLGEKHDIAQIIETKGLETQEIRQRFVEEKKLFEGKGKGEMTQEVAPEVTRERILTIAKQLHDKNLSVALKAVNDLTLIAKNTLDDKIASAMAEAIANYLKYELHNPSPNEIVSGKIFELLYMKLQQFLTIPNDTLLLDLHDSLYAIKNSEYAKNFSEKMRTRIYNMTRDLESSLVRVIGDSISSDQLNLQEKKEQITKLFNFLLHNIDVYRTAAFVELTDIIKNPNAETAFALVEGYSSYLKNYPNAREDKVMLSQVMKSIDHLAKLDIVKESLNIEQNRKSLSALKDELINLRDNHSSLVNRAELNSVLISIATLLLPYTEDEDSL